MTPTLEEITSFIGKRFNIRGADLCNKRPRVPKNVDAKKFLDLLKINQIEKENLKIKVGLTGLSIGEVRPK
ncbi:hypothetical protein H5410_005880 [Solanum commersonii]|uniref:Uncharacterized protein n=1 Tax=Solanum commersonii TaxID=4109 RepID=A0A9J6A7M4_SOLCO|nr:hypothetical protein H5410_005880 [Solanum commersonii]